MNHLTTPVITALVCSARRRGNAYDLADYCLEGLRAGPYRRVRLLNFYEYDVQACQHCDYECLAGQPACPLKDDVAWLWEYTWRSDAVIWSVPSYDGMPPAVWSAFMQRLRSVGRQTPGRRMPLAVISIADSDDAGETTPDLLRRQAGQPGWNLIDFAVFGPREQGCDPVAGGLVKLPDVQQRLDSLVEAITKALPDS